MILRTVFGDPGALDLEEYESFGTSALTVAECHRALDRLRLRGAHGSPQLHRSQGSIGQLLGTVELLALSSNVLNRAAYPYPVPLGTLDAIHLATALVWMDVTGEAVTFATHDEGLACAAREMRLPVIGVAASR